MSLLQISLIKYVIYLFYYFFSFVASVPKQNSEYDLEKFDII